MYNVRSWVLDKNRLRLVSSNQNKIKGQHLIFSTTDSRWFKEYFDIYRFSILEKRDLYNSIKLYKFDNLFCLKKYISLNLKYINRKNNFIEFNRIRNRTKKQLYYVLYVIIDYFFKSNKKCDYIEVSRYQLSKDIERIFNVKLTERQVRYALDKLNNIGYIEKKLVKISPINNDNIFKINVLHIKISDLLVNRITNDKIYKRLYDYFNRSEPKIIVDLVKKDFINKSKNSVKSILFLETNLLNSINLLNIENGKINLSEIFNLMLKDILNNKINSNYFSYKIFQYDNIINKYSEINLEDVDKRLILGAISDKHFDLLKDYKAGFVFSDFSKRYDYILVFDFYRLKSIEYSIVNFKYLNPKIKKKIMNYLNDISSKSYIYELPGISGYFRNLLYLTSLLTYYQISKNRLEVLKELKEISF
ncbi:MAG: hypothetical protein KatS3mg068_1570 [Candidatus Sericytochromatia bacterium]|nr:MAG: hypothetical protein KatS3mg068_1570 [Candidatus Sericytochromatia bacterium]